VDAMGLLWLPRPNEDPATLWRAYGRRRSS
jgi:hypothetical protein